MYSFLLKARIKGEDEYEFFYYQGKKPVEVSFRGKPIQITKGTRFGVRKSSSGKDIRLVFPGDLTLVITIDLPTAKALANGVGPKE